MAQTPAAGTAAAAMPIGRALFAAEVEQRAARMQSELDFMCASIKIAVEQEISRLPLRIRTMPIAEFERLAAQGTLRPPRCCAAGFPLLTRRV
eukprot:m51a1_g9849 hypothetical protein (93) ;mRNA; r:1969674-1970112